MAHTGYRETIYIGPPPPRPSNSLGLAGFLVSLVGGPLTCGMLSPLGFILSLIALRKAPRGFAIPGVIIGAIGTLFVGGAMLSTAQNAHRHEVRKKTAITRAQLEEAKDIIVEHQIETGEVPKGIEGNKLVLHLEDGWETPVRYDLITEGEHKDTYILRSAGPDGEWETRDDITKR